jgi:hypothetical protein
MPNWILCWQPVSVSDLWVGAEMVCCCDLNPMGRIQTCSLSRSTFKSCAHEEFAFEQPKRLRRSGQNAGVDFADCVCSSPWMCSPSVKALLGSRTFPYVGIWDAQDIDCQDRSIRPPYR